MWKWLVGILVVLVLFIAVGSWWGYQAMQSNLSPDGTERVTIAGPPSRVFASLANGDSVLKWMSDGNAVTSSRHGTLAVGDSLQIGLKSNFGVARRPMTWQVTAVTADKLLAYQLLSDSTHRVVAMRRDSLVAKGDSTTIISTVGSPMFDSLLSAREQKGKVRSGLVGLSSDLVLSAFRMQSKLDLLTLKAHIEGTPRPQRR